MTRSQSRQRRFDRADYSIKADFGGARGSRTPDLLNAIQALSQLSYGPSREQVSAIRQQISGTYRQTFLPDP
jgi:hypothetical protein